MLYFDPNSNSNVRKSTSSRLFPETSTVFSKPPLSISDILLRKQLEIISFSDYKTIDEKLIDAANNIGNSFKETEQFLTFLRKVCTDTDHEGLYPLNETISHGHPILTLCYNLKSIGAIMFFNFVNNTNCLYVKVNVNAIGFINKTWVQLYLASLAEASINPDEIWLNGNLKNIYNADRYIYDVVYLKNGGMHAVLANLKPLLIDTPNAIDRLTKMVSRFKSNVTIVCASNIDTVSLKNLLAINMKPDVEFQVMTINQFTGNMKK